jgi:hypothetical protein
MPPIELVLAWLDNDCLRITQVFVSLAPDSY